MPVLENPHRENPGLEPTTLETANLENTNLENNDACEVRAVHPQAVARAQKAVPDDACVTVASDLLKAVADPTRLRILSALAATELCVCDLSLITGVSESAVSHQLRLLRQHRLVLPRKEGRVVYYQLADAHVTLLLENALEHAREG